MKRTIRNDAPDAAVFVAEYIQQMAPVGDRPVVFVCVGTDRSSGDSLGPMVGTFLSERGVDHVCGTLEDPVHAGNLVDILGLIERRYDNPFVVAVDACLGRSEAIGLVTVEDLPLRPGKGVDKVLPEVGDVTVTGVVNMSGFMEYFVLQNTRLGLVYKMARVISEGLHQWVTTLPVLAEVAIAEEGLCG